MDYNYHRHDYGLGRTLSRWFWAGVLIIVGWWLIVLVINFPWVMLIFGGLILAAALVWRGGSRKARE